MPYLYWSRNNIQCLKSIPGQNQVSCTPLVQMDCMGLVKILSIYAIPKRNLKMYTSTYKTIHQAKNFLQNILL